MRLLRRAQSRCSSGLAACASSLDRGDTGDPSRGTAGHQWVPVYQGLDRAVQSYALPASAPDITLGKKGYPGDRSE